MYEYEEKSDIIGSPCSLMNPYKGYTEGTIVGDYGNTVVVRPDQRERDCRVP